MPFVVEYERDGARLVLSGHVGVADAAALHAALLELAAVPGRVAIDQARLAGCDASLVQLAIAFGRARRAAGRPLSLGEGPLTDRLVQLDLAREVEAEAPTPR